MRTPWQHRVLALALALSLSLATCGPGAAAAAGDESARRQDAAGGELAQVGLDMHDLAASSLSDDEVLERMIEFAAAGLRARAAATTGER